MLSMLDNLGIKYLVLSENYREELIQAKNYMLTESKIFALIIKKNTFSTFTLPEEYISPLTMTRELALNILLKKIDKKSLLISTTGKTSRELYELREARDESHERDFLTVGSMGHTASLALGVALSTDKDVFCIDGDGSFIMHMGSLGIVANNLPINFKYILINNGSHESVGGQPTIGFKIDLRSIFIGLGFKHIYTTNDSSEILEVFDEFKKYNHSILIVNVKQGSRENLGRPKSSPVENKRSFMNFINKKDL
jgi:phosphonopyruvate decarboxylase